MRIRSQKCGIDALGPQSLVVHWPSEQAVNSLHSEPNASGITNVSPAKTLPSPAQLLSADEATSFATNHRCSNCQDQAKFSIRNRSAGTPCPVWCRTGIARATDWRLKDRTAEVARNGTSRSGKTARSAAAQRPDISVRPSHCSPQPITLIQIADKIIFAREQMSGTPQFILTTASKTQPGNVGWLLQSTGNLPSMQCPGLVLWTRRSCSSRCCC